MPDTTVKNFESTYSGISTISGTAGSLITVLNACLVDGFGSVTLTSLVLASDVATATVSGGHNFVNYGGIAGFGPVITIAGATPSGLNGEWRVNVTGVTTFTFSTSGISDQTATGTITAKRSPAGWSKVYSATNKAVYRADSELGTRRYLRVDDTSTTWATLVGYEIMTGVDTGTNGYTAYLQKSATADSTARAWQLISDHQTLHMMITYGSSLYVNAGLMFGDLIPNNSADAYHSIIAANHDKTEPKNNYFHRPFTYEGRAITRQAQQTGTAVHCKFISTIHSTGQSFFGEVGANYPNPVDNALHLAYIEVWDNSANIYRGIIPGAYNPRHNYGWLTDGLVVYNSNMLSVSRRYQTGYITYDILGPWR